MVRNDDVTRASEVACAIVERELAARRYHGRLDDRSPHRRLLLAHEHGDVASRYALVIVAAKRARQINNYHHQLGEGIGLRRRAAAARRVALEELPDDGDGRDRPGQDRLRRYPPVAKARRAAVPARRTLSDRPRPASAAERHDRHNVPVARILLGVTGGIAAYKACELVRLLVKAGHDVLAGHRRVAPSGSSRPRPSARSRASAAGRPVPAPRRADLLVVAPLTANTLARLAHGLADDVLTEAALAHRGPVLVAPAMNTAHVGAPGDPGEPRPLLAARRRASSARTRASSPRARSARGGWRSRRDRRPGRGAARRPRAYGSLAGSTCSSPRAGRASRSTRPLRRQPLVGPDGRRARRRGARARRARDAPRGEPARCRRPPASRSCRRPTAADLSARRSRAPTRTSS